MSQQQENQINPNHEQEKALTRQEIEAKIITQAWKDEAYKQELLANPKAVVGEAFGVEFAEEVTVKVLDENSTSLHLVLPMSPMQIASELAEASNGLSETELEQIAGGGIFNIPGTTALGPKPNHWRRRSVYLGAGVLSTFSVGAGLGLIDRFKKKK